MWNTFFGVIAVMGVFALNTLAESSKYKNELGNKIIINKDTLQIIDYNTIQESFMLSNGATINYIYYLKQQKIK